MILNTSTEQQICSSKVLAWTLRSKLPKYGGGPGPWVMQTNPITFESYFVVYTYPVPLGVPRVFQ